LNLHFLKWLNILEISIKIWYKNQIFEGNDKKLWNK
jgi:hypothetical protein